MLKLTPNDSPIDTKILPNEEEKCYNDSSIR